MIRAAKVRAARKRYLEMAPRGWRLATGKSRYGESDVLSVPAMRKDGATISVEFTVMPLQQEGRIIGIAAIMRDVTARFNEMRELKQKLRDKI